METINEILHLSDNPKAWIVLIGGTLLSMIVGRFVYAFKSGAGIRDAALSVWLGTNEKKDKQP